jgi:hypothetical protein
LADAGKATAGNRTDAVYATSWCPTGDSFPMVWTPDSETVPGTDVTDRYVAIYTSREDLRAASGNFVAVEFSMYNRSVAGVEQSGDRVAANVDVFCNGEQMGGGRTSGPTQDMNDVLTFTLEKNATYEFRYTDAAGNPATVTAKVGEEPMTVKGYLNN